MPTIDTGRMRQAFLDRPGQEPVLWIHGAFATRRWWEPLIDLLPGRYRCLVPDLRGCGESERADSVEAFDVQEQARDLWAFVDVLGLDDVHLVGHSYGAAIALQMAVDRPGGVRTLSLIAPPSPDGVETPQEGLLALEQMRTDRALLARALSSIMPARAPDAFFHSLVDDALQQSPAAFTGPALGLSRWRVRHRLSALRLPVLLIWGDRDIIVERRDVTDLLLAIPGANNLEVLRGLGHSPHVEAPERVWQVLEPFLSEDFDEFEDIRSRA